MTIRTRLNLVITLAHFLSKLERGFFSILTQLNWRHIQTNTVGTQSHIFLRMLDTIVNAQIHICWRDSQVYTVGTSILWEKPPFGTLWSTTYCIPSHGPPTNIKEVLSLCFVCLTLSLSVCVCYCLSLSVCVSDFISVCLCPSVSVCLSVFLTVSMSVCV